ncbi:hypothetical protein ABKN59_003143 [Abortiporus biennis]
MQAVKNSLHEILESLPPHPITKETFDCLVSETLSKPESASSAEHRKVLWEYALRNEIFALASTEGQALKDPNTKYYEQLRDRLDLVLTFTENDVCEQVFPFNILADLLETQTIPSCSHIFSWIEERAGRLTEGMIPQKGKALVLLRTLNDLLRRLSKMGSTTRFCGRILTFLSRVFPLGERSGVNLRGEYGPAWEGPGVFGEYGKAEVQVQPVKEETKEEDAKMQVDEEKPEGESEKQEEEQKDDFYNTFWSLQYPFSRPTMFAQPQTFGQFKDAVNKVLPVIKEATAKERALMGSKTSLSSTSTKRKREPDGITEAAGKDYFFAKYLTSPELLDLEISDTHFRRQFLFQLLILLNHLLQFTKTLKAEWASTKNRSLHMNFTLEGEDAQWVQETIIKAYEELRQTAPNGRAFAETVHVILDREKNWVKWKNDLCAPFDREAWSEEVEENGVKRKIGLEEATKGVRQKMSEEPKDWKYSLGSEALTEIWTMGYRDLSDLATPFQAGDVKDFVKKVKLEDARIDMRKKQLLKTAERIAQARAKAAAASAPSPAPVPVPVTPQEPVPAPVPTAPRSMPSSGPVPLQHPLPAKPGTSPPKPQPTLEPSPAPVVPTPAPVVTPSPAPAPVPIPVPPPVELPPDEQITKYEENKQRLCWLALRIARDIHLQHLTKIGTGDIVKLEEEIEKEKEQEEKSMLDDSSLPSSQEVGGQSPMPSSSSAEVKTGDGQLPNGAPRDMEGDVKMEG